MNYKIITSINQIKHFCICFLIVLSLSSIGTAQNPDLKVVIHEKMLNKLFSAIGEIKGTSEYSVFLFKGEYHWTLNNPKINLHPNNAEFTSNVNVTVGKLNYSNTVIGNMEVCYEPTTNLIYVEMQEAFYPLKFMFLGKEKHITDINIAKYFETPFTFEGPLSATTEMSFEMPDKSIKKIKAAPIDCSVKIIENAIVVSANVEFN